MSSELSKTYAAILKGLKAKIREARMRASLSVNAQLLEVYWEIGDTILKQQAAEGWGAKVIQRLSSDLKAEFTDMKGLSIRSIKYMRAFAESYPDFRIVQQAAAQLTAEQERTQMIAQIPWTHHQVLLDKVKDVDQRFFYLHQITENGWSRDILKRQIESNLFARKGAALTNFSHTLPTPQSDLARETLKNPYVFDFLSLGDKILEREFEQALISHLKKFLLELGRGFAYVGNQYNLMVEEDDFFLDLLFYNTKLHCYVVFELKVGDFKPEYAGKLNFYINTVDEQIRSEGDQPTIGVLLCKTPNKTVVEYSLRGVHKPLGVAEYELSHSLPDELKPTFPTIEELETELEKEIELAQSPLNQKLARIKTVLEKMDQEEIQEERSAQNVQRLLDELLFPLHASILQKLTELKIDELFASQQHRIEIGNRTFQEVKECQTLDPDQPLPQELRLLYWLEGLKKVGTQAFSCSRDVFIDLDRFKYRLGFERRKTELERLYHQPWDLEAIEEIAERVVTHILDQIQERLKALGYE